MAEMVPPDPKKQPERDLSQLSKEVKRPDFAALGGALDKPRSTQAWESLCNLLIGERVVLPEVEEEVPFDDFHKALLERGGLWRKDSFAVMDDMRRAVDLSRSQTGQ